jgi:dihydroflavonol-4-reductase
MKVAITGGTGHIGANMVRALLAKGWSVRALIHEDARSVEGLPIVPVPGDVEDPGTLAPLFEGVDLAFHLAGHITLQKSEAAHAFAVNVEGTRNVMQACRKAGVPRVVHFSSIHAYDDRTGLGPIDEDRGPMVDPRRPLYGLSKAAGEKVVLEAVANGLDAVIVNPTGVLGPNDYKGSRMGRLLASMASGAMPIVPRAGYDWVDARDVAAGAILAAQRGRTGQRYILAGSWASLDDLGRLVDEAQGLPRTRLKVPLWAAWMGVPFDTVKCLFSGKDPQVTPDSIKVLYGESRVTYGKAAIELGYAPRSLQRTVDDTISWMHSAEAASLACWRTREVAS